MTSRMHAPHTTCPGCREEVYLDELVKGRCPLCGCSLEEYEDDDQDAEDLMERFDLSWLVFNYFVFKKFIDMGASPVRIMQLVSTFEEHCVKSLGLHSDTTYEFELPHTVWDRIRLKRCSGCGKLFIRGGKKVVSGDLSSPEFSVSYRCPGC